MAVGKARLVGLPLSGGWTPAAEGQFHARLRPGGLNSSRARSYRHRRRPQSATVPPPLVSVELERGHKAAAPVGHSGLAAGVVADRWSVGSVDAVHLDPQNVW